jgi:hypothetical protein
MGELDSTNGESSMIKALAPQHPSYALFHSPVILFDYIRLFSLMSFPL